jgi:predicted MFS family arabinose efflux permease
VLVRAGLFAFAGSALWALLPVVASAQLRITSTGYGLLLGCLGAGSVVGAAALPRLRARYSADRMVGAGIVLFAVATLGLAVIEHYAPVAAAMVGGGMAWITIMSTFNVCAQMAPPVLMRARALAFYILVFQGALAIGSSVWGAAARYWTVRGSLEAAAVMMIAGLATARVLRLEPKIVEDKEYVA